MLLWRILSGCLPLKNRLGYVQESDKACDFCGIQTEDDVHLFRDCHFARCLWFVSPSGVLNGNLSTLNFEEWFMWMLESKNEALILFGACVIEHIWQCRNNLIFKGCNPNLDQSIRMLNQRVKEFNSVLLQHSYSAVSNISTTNSQVCWDVQLRVDASVQEGRAGFCAVQIQNVQEEGFVILQHIAVDSVLEAEFLAIVEALKWAVEQKANTVQVESDSLIAVKALETKALPFAWGSYPAFVECCNLVKLFDVCVVSFIPRDDNSVADSLARYSRVSSVNSRCWLREIAPFVAITL
ncbi:hypothetical protein CsatB_001150 [Cannabis sativa]